MTDNEIIKALECCGNENFRCDECPCQSFRYSECYELVTANVLDLINRQQAEFKALTIRTAKQEATIERLEDEKSALQSEVSDAQAEIERLRKMVGEVERAE